MRVSNPPTSPPSMPPSNGGTQIIFASGIAVVAVGVALVIFILQL